MKDLKEILEDNSIPGALRLQKRARAMNTKEAHPKKADPACKRCKGKGRVARPASLFPRIPEVAVKCGCS